MEGGDPGVGPAEWTRRGERSAGYIADSRVHFSHAEAFWQPLTSFATACVHACMHAATASAGWIDTACIHELAVARSLQRSTSTRTVVVSKTAMVFCR